MATLERIHFVPHYLVRRENAVAYSPSSSRPSIEGLPQIFGSSRNPGKDRNKNADLRDDVSANKHILKPAFLCTILIRFCPFGRAFLSLRYDLTATTC